MTFSLEPTGLNKNTTSSSTSFLIPLANKVLSALEGCGWVVVKNFAAEVPLLHQRSLFVTLCELVGRLVGHDRDGKMVWSIKARQPGKDTHAQMAAFDFMKCLVRNSTQVKRRFLEEKNIIFISNKVVLHGRGGFSDPERHLLRVRVNKRNTREV